MKGAESVSYLIDGLLVKKWYKPDKDKNGKYPGKGEFHMTIVEDSAWYKCLVALSKTGAADEKLILDDSFVHGLEEHYEPSKIFSTYVNQLKLWPNIHQTEHIRILAMEQNWHGKDPIKWPWDDAMTYKQFIKLYEDIRDNGFDAKLEPPILIVPRGSYSSRNKNNEPYTKEGKRVGTCTDGHEVLDGQHRVSILKYLGFKEIVITYEPNVNNNAWEVYKDLKLK